MMHRVMSLRAARIVYLYCSRRDQVMTLLRDNLYWLCIGERILFKLSGGLQPTKALSTLSQKSETVAENGDCRRKRRENGDSRTFSTTV